MEINLTSFPAQRTAKTVCALYVWEYGFMSVCLKNILHTLEEVISLCIHK